MSDSDSLNALKHTSAWEIHRD
uniref:Uncharacterized protein n=1 Tax=Anguilla anguilla TaxID=7936 RepID=A0A0E9S9D8_ANGAN